MHKTLDLPKCNSADGRYYWMKPEVETVLKPLLDQCIQDAIDGKITRLDSLWPPVVVSSQGAPFEVWELLRTWTEAQQAETLDADKAIAFCETCADRAGGAILTIPYLICSNGSFKRSILLRQAMKMTTSGIVSAP